MKEIISLVFVLIIFGLLWLAQYTAKPISVGSSSESVNGFHEFDVVPDSTGYDLIYMDGDSIKHTHLKK